jgi:hypothetical protein
MCSDWLYIDGKVEGAISLSGGRRSPLAAMHKWRRISLPVKWWFWARYAAMCLGDLNRSLKRKITFNQNWILFMLQAVDWS